MSQPAPRDHRIIGNPLLDTVASLAVFVLFFFVCRPKVPSEDPVMINVWGAITSLCMTGVFWLAWQMFKVTLRGQRDTRADED